jgi:integrase
MLTLAAAKAATPRDRAYKLADAGGLFLFVTPAGTRSWRLKYRRAGREQLKVLGRFPDLSLAQAREARDRFKRSLTGNHIDSCSTFEQLAHSWYEHNRTSWSPAHAADVIASLERDLFPGLGNKAIAEIDAPCLLNAMRSVENRGCIETARRIRQRLSAIFGFAIAQGMIAVDPAAHLGRAMGKARPPRPMPALTSIEHCRELLAATEQLVVSNRMIPLASRFLALTAVRLEAVRGMCWGEEDLEARIWRVPAARMKLSRAKKELAQFDHLVPLSPQAVDVLRAAAMSTFSTSNEDAKRDTLVFPGRLADAPIGEGALRDLYSRAGFGGRHVPHGWRSSFSTILNEELGPEWRGDIDRALAHSPKDKVEAAYNRAEQLGRRRQVFDRWGELLTG